MLDVFELVFDDVLELVFEEVLLDVLELVFDEVLLDVLELVFDEVFELELLDCATRRWSAFSIADFTSFASLGAGAACADAIAIAADATVARLVIVIFLMSYSIWWML